MAFAVPSTAVLQELMSPDFDPCRALAVDIKHCLKENHTFDGVCEPFIKQMNDCCKSWSRRSDSCARYQKVFPSSITGR